MDVTGTTVYRVQTSEFGREGSAGRNDTGTPDLDDDPGPLDSRSPAVSGTARRPWVPSGSHKSSAQPTMECVPEDAPAGHPVVRPEAQRQNDEEPLQDAEEATEFAFSRKVLCRPDGFCGHERGA